MIASQFGAECAAVLHHGSPAKFAAPDDERFSKQAALLQVLDQRGGTLVRCRRNFSWSSE